MEGPVLVTGSSRGIGRSFAEWLSGMAPDATGQACPVVRHGSGARGSGHAAEVIEAADFTDAAAIDEMVGRLEARFPGGVSGLVHFASCPLDSAGMADGVGEATAIIDVHLTALVHLVGRLVPLMRRHAGPCRILTVSSGAALGVPSSWSLPSGQQVGMYSLVKSFVEQYTEALAFELRRTQITVCCARVEGTFRTELHDLTRSAAAQPVSDLLPALQAIWKMPSAEAHGRVIPARPRQRPRAGQISGGSAVGASADCRFALRAAVSGLSEYPPSGRPEAYAALAGALGLPAASLCWFHGSSDAIMRCTAARLGCLPRLGPGAAEAARARGETVAVQAPTWHNAAELLRSAGARGVATVPYGNPWLEEGGDSRFWEALETALQGPDPPALVYLVHPHFPTGFRGEDFNGRLAWAVRDSPTGTLFLVDQCYLGFVDGGEVAEDGRALEEMAMASDSVVLVRSLSKVEGLAGVRLGYTVASVATTRKLSAGLPFGGGLYVSEIDLAAAVAALLAPDAAERRAEVVRFYAGERAWLSDALAELGLEVTPSVGPFACLRGPERALRDAAKEGAQVIVYACPTVSRQSAESPLSPPKASAVFLVADREANRHLVDVLRRKLKADEGGFKLPWIGW